MAYYLNLFSLETYEAFMSLEKDVSGFRIRHLNTSKRVKPGDILVCYMTKLSRWFGLLEVLGPSYLDNTPRLYEENDPFVVRFKVKPIILLPKEKGIPIHEDEVWNTLTITRGHDKRSSTWTGKLRTSLVPIEDQDAKYIERLLHAQVNGGTTYPVDEEKYKKFVTKRVRRIDRTVSVSVPEEEEGEDTEASAEGEVRESIKIQAMLARIGETMGFRIWIPRNDRTRVHQSWKDGAGVLLDNLPLNYDDTTLKTIEQIDVLWLKGRSIARAFEVEHTTSIYSGILRMADLLALQPNMDINLHLVAPYSRRDKVFQEIQRPVFSLLDKGPLSEYCTFISYESLEELANQPHLNYLSDSVLEEYSEEAS